MTTTSRDVVLSTVDPDLLKEVYPYENTNDIMYLVKIYKNVNF